PSAALRVPTAKRLFQVAAALHDGVSQEEVIAQTELDPWFVQEMAELMDIHKRVLDIAAKNGGTPSENGARHASPLLDHLNQEDFFKLKRHGFSDAYIAQLLGVKEAEVRERRKSLGVKAN